MSDRARLLELINKIAVVRGKVILSSGAEADWYVDLRRVALHHEGGPILGRVMLEATADLEYDVVGGLTLGADPVASAMLHAAAAQGRKIDACVVRKAQKVHGLQRQVEGPGVEGRRVLALDDTSTTGNSILQAVDGLRSAGAEVVGAGLVIDRGAGPAIADAGLTVRAAYTMEDLTI